MKIFVCVKQVPDTETKIKIAADGNGIETSGVKWVMNPYDEFAVEEALKLKQAQGADCNVTVVSVGPKKRIVDALRTALAMGADDAIAVDAPENMDPSLTAQALAKAIEAEGGQASVIFTGKLAIDDNAASVSQMVAAHLKIPHSTVVSKFEYKGETVVVERDVEGGAKEVVEMKLPALVGANKGLNMPRYASLPGIMKAKKKPLKEVDLTGLGLSADQIKVKYTGFSLPPEKPPVKMIEGDAHAQASELVKRLRDEAKVL